MPRIEAMRKVNAKSSKEIIQNYKKSLREAKENTLVLCTSKSFSSTLMWSHYAEMHTGVCLGLMMPPFMEWENGTVNQINLPVIYTEKIIAENYFQMQGESDPLGLYKWLCSKSIDWSYEEEVRSIIIDAQNKVPKVRGEYYDMPFHPSLVKEIYFGLRTK